MRMILMCTLFIISCGCISEETRQLAQGICKYQELQGTRVKRLADFALAGEFITRDEHTKTLLDQSALSVASKALTEILGEPKNPVEVIK